MITDVFYKRYAFPMLHSDKLPAAAQTFFRQAALILLHDVAPLLSSRDEIFRSSHQRLTRELGAGFLADGETYEDRCISFVGEAYDLWNDRHGTADWFFKLRLSAVELLFREIEARCKSVCPTGTPSLWEQIAKKRGSAIAGSQDVTLPDATRAAVEELNVRFREARIPLSYHNGLIQFTNNEFTTDQIEKPFWDILSEQKWKNADSDMKEALDRRDNSKSDAAFYALKALESVVKIISDERGWTRGKENGAAAYIDNLVSQSNGRFIDVWEADAMKFLFGQIRNPQGHGAGSQAPLLLSTQQSSFVIECAMSWIKSLAQRP